MSWYAIDAVDEAIDATREFLFPFDRGRWLRLLVITFFVGGGGTGFNWVQQFPSGRTPDQLPTNPGAVSPATDWIVVLALVFLGIVVLLALVSTVVGPIMRFVFLDALRTGEVRIRGSFRRRFLKGIRLLGFTLGLGVLLVTVVAMLFLAVTSGGLAIVEQFPNSGTGSLIGVLTIVLGVFVGLGAIVGVVVFFHFTSAFVAPTMLATDSGVFAAWSRFYTVFRNHLGQFVAYLVARILLAFATAILLGVVGLIFLVVIGIGTFMVAFVVAAAFGGFTAALESTAGLVAIGVVVLLGVLVNFVFVSLPLSLVQLTFYTTYELTVLGAADERLALLGDGGEVDGDTPGGGVGTVDGDGPDDDGPGEFQFGVVEPEDGVGEDDRTSGGDPVDTAGTPTDDETGTDQRAGIDGDADAEEDDEDDFSTPFWRD